MFASMVMSVIVHDPYIKRVACCKTEADAPLVIDANAPLPDPTAVQRFEPV